MDFAAEDRLRFFGLTETSTIDVSYRGDDSVVRISGEGLFGDEETVLILKGVHVAQDLGWDGFSSSLLVAGSDLLG